MFDSSSVKAAELLSYFGRNTAVLVRHNYGHNALEVVSARTNNVISVVMLSKYMDLAYVATEIMADKKFPRNRKMNRTWSPIRFSAKSQAMMDADSGISFS